MTITWDLKAKIIAALILFLVPAIGIALINRRRK